MNGITSTIHNLWNPKPSDHQKSWFSWLTLKKVTFIAFAVLLMFAPLAKAMAAPVMICDENGICHNLQNRIAPDSDQPIIKFPKDFGRMFHNEFVSNQEGNRYCIIGKKLPDPTECDRFSNEMEQAVRIIDPEGLDKHLKESTAFVEKGVTLRTPVTESIRGVTVGTNPQKKKNFEKVLSHLEKTVLQNPQFFDQNQEQIVGAIKKTHKILTTDLPTYGGRLTPGQFRNFDMFVTEDREEDTTQELINIAIKNGAQKEAPKELNKFIKKLSKATTTTGLLNSLSQRNKKFFRKYVGHLPPRPEKVASLMLQFVGRIKNLGRGVLNGTIHAIDAAAEVHQKIGQIHPFADANGRLARSWMNTFLELGGYRAIVFPDDDTYTAAVTKDERDPGKGHFASFLEETILWNRRQNQERA